MDAGVKADSAAKAYENPKYRYFALAMLLLLYVLNYIDRQIVGILAPLIQKDLNLTDTQLGLLGGIAFALLYSLLGLPVARLADRYKRVNILTGAVVLWSAFTALCGAASNFFTLFLMRIGVGVGEAGGTAPSYSLISDIFPQHQRGRALSVFFLGSQLGGALGIVLGGHLAPELGWRATFVVIGSVGLIVAPLFYFLVREPPRGFSDDAATKAKPKVDASLADVLRFVRATPALWFLMAGSALAAMFNYGFAFWLPSLMLRSFDMGLSALSNFLALAFLIGGSAGMLCAGILADWLSKRDAGAYGMVGCFTILFSIPFVVGAAMITDFWIAIVCIVIAVVTSNNWGPTATTAVQNVTPASMRTTVSALYLMVVNLLGLGLGTVVFGIASDALTAQFQDDALRYAFVICVLALYPAAAACLFMAGRLMRKHAAAAAP